MSLAVQMTTESEWKDVGAMGPVHLVTSQISKVHLR